MLFVESWFKYSRPPIPLPGQGKKQQCRKTAVRGVINNQEKRIWDFKISGGIGGYDSDWGKAVNVGAVLGGGGQRRGGMGGDDCTLNTYVPHKHGQVRYLCCLYYHYSPLHSR